MNVRSWGLAVFAAVAAAGCGAPKAEKFVDSRVTKALHPEAAAVTRLEIERRFGTPENLVAWMEFSNAIDFGRIEGKVVPGKGTLDKHQFAVALTSDRPLTAADVQGLGLIWKSGAYVDAVYEAPKADAKRGVKKGENVPAWFHVGGFQPDEDNDGQGVLSVNYLLETPVKPGDTFVLVGHRLRSGRKLYMRHCMHCHGYSGDGQGPTAKYLNPRPRDYRLGKFKFTSTGGPSKASRADLKRIIRKGIPGTYMPSFLLTFQDGELRDVVEYVRWLALRGETERKLALNLYSDYSKEAWAKTEDSAKQKYQDAYGRWKKGELPKEPALESFRPQTLLQKYRHEYLQEDLADQLKTTTGAWVNAESPNVIVRAKVKRHAATHESISRGRALFLSKKTLCWSCHGVSGRGDGYQTTSFQKNNDPLATSPTRPEPGFYDEWGNKIRPRNLTSGIYRGGRRPVDIYRRIAVGIKGTPMSGFGTTLSDRQIWDLVNYVFSVPLANNGASSSREDGGTHVSRK
ncbi:MAG: c-type cytochrome [Planctomycetaceae bacterium]